MIRREKFTIGDTIQHLRRGSRYRITGHVRAYANKFKDNQVLYVLVGPYGEKLINSIEQLLYCDNHGYNLIGAVTLQMDPESLSHGDRTSCGAIYLDCFIYDAIDPAELSDAPVRFLRPVVEFTEDRFRILGDKTRAGLVAKVADKPLRDRLLAVFPDDLTRADLNACDKALEDPEIERLCSLVAGDKAPGGLRDTCIDLARHVAMEEGLL